AVRPDGDRRRPHRRGVQGRHDRLTSPPGRAVARRAPVPDTTRQRVGPGHPDRRQRGLMQATNIRRLPAAIWGDPRGRRGLVRSQLARVGMVIFDLLIPQAIRSIVNNGILAGNFDWVIRGALYMAIFAVASALFSTANAWFAARVGEEVGHRLRLAVYGRVTELS